MSEISVDLANENVSVIAEPNKLRDEIRELNEQVESEQYNARRWREEYEKLRSNHLRAVFQKEQTQNEHDELRAEVKRLTKEIRELEESVDYEKSIVNQWREQYEKLAPSHDRLILKNEQLQKERDGLLATIHSRVNGEKADIDFANKELVKYQQACARLLAERMQAEALTRVAWEEGETLRAQLDYAKAWRDRYQTLYTEFRDNVKRAARNRQLKAERRKEKQRKRKLKRKYGSAVDNGEYGYVADWQYGYTIIGLYRQWQRLRTSNPPLAQALRERLNEWKEAQRVKTNPHRS